MTAEVLRVARDVVLSIARGRVDRRPAIAIRVRYTKRGIARATRLMEKLWAAGPMATEQGDWRLRERTDVFYFARQPDMQAMLCELLCR